MQTLLASAEEVGEKSFAVSVGGEIWKPLPNGNSLNESRPEGDDQAIAARGGLTEELDTVRELSGTENRARSGGECGEGRPDLAFAVQLFVLSAGRGMGDG